MIKCLKCGAELSDDARFCSYCGNKIKAPTSPPIIEDELPIKEKSQTLRTVEDELIPTSIVNAKEVNEPKPLTEKIKAKGIEFWNKRSLYGKVVTVALAVFILLALVAFIAKKAAAAIIAFLQIVLVAVSICIHKDIIKLEPKKIWIKYLALAVAIILTALNIMSYSWGTKTPSTSQNLSLSNESSEDEMDAVFGASIDSSSSAPIKKTAVVPCGAAECLGVNYELIIDQFKDAGFKKVSVEATADLGLENIAQKGEIYEITIDGSAVFDVGDELDKNAVVKILYHDAMKIAAPISHEDATDKDLAELIKLFEDAGFVNLTTETAEDIDPEYSQETFRNDILIGNKDSFTSADTFPIDAEVKIVTHIPYEKYIVTLHVNFIPNLLFNKYGVDVSRNYTELGTLSHGEDGDFEMWLKPGKHTFKFTRVSYNRPTKEVTIDVKGETEIFYDLICYEDSIHIDKTAHIDMGAIGENEAVVPAANLDFIYTNYKDVEAQLKEAGFTNISTSILYDIFFGWTVEGEVDSVKINGKTDYIVGDVFAKDVPIIITYHMLEEDDPSRIPMPDSSTSYVGKDYKEVEKIFKNLGFTNIVVESSATSDTSYTDGDVYSVKADYESFEKGNTYASDDRITIRYYIVEKSADDNSSAESATVDDTTKIVLPQEDSKLGKDFDIKSTSTVYYINTDNISNKPSITTWGTATVTDGVAEYLNYLESLGFTVTITDTIHKEPYAGFHMYETDFKASNDSVSWTMYLCIQSEKYIEYEFDIRLN